ncbi:MULTISPECIES: ABC transporter substrate-binding protein [Brucella]|uniref:Branched-chain amino acid ABC transporter, amino acid-binding protein (TC 3.A.1.4.1) n=1 Tax=Ochrobactrum soli TaxID=2448455 RepID=A0A2P9HCW4_9HYPH|nr:MULTISPECIES: ABC transporter substrate-binding protein [Brucella]MCI1000479.1 ABC transporter substrate-binding protein [Ochrobactrum sp. C6C9]MDX4071969.1 ABC transporter substrate-binding protein [Brucella sp. NBRC 113783]SPL61905.1 Branched-chain amino acid ABC transporter, amino acid-binding protein (TC 3.A.1.4.1) [[Ochrobactrum] soli]
MQINRRNLLLSSAGFMAAGLLPGFQSAVRAASGDPVKIGWFAALSGPYSTGALAQDAGHKAAIAELNAKGGVLGRPLELVARDTVADPGKAVNFVQELLFSEKVNVLFGPNTSGEAMPIRDFIAEANTINMPTALIDHVIDPEAYPTIFRVGGSAGQQIEAGITFALDHYKKQKIALFVDNLSYGVLCRDLALEKMKARNIEPVYVGTLDANKVDLGDDIIKARNSGADVLLVWSAASSFMARVLTARGEQKWDIPAICAPIALNAQITDLVKKEYLDGAVGVGFRHLAVDGNGKFAAGIETLLAEQASIVGPQLKNGITWILLGYASTKLWATAVEKAGSVETDAVIAALETMGTTETLFGKVGFGPGSREGLSMDEYALFTISSFQNGGFTLA